MGKYLYKYLVIFSLALLMFGCKTKVEQSQVVTVSILPQKQWVEIMTKGQIAVNCMVPGGSSPESYSPSPKQMTDLSNSSHYFYIEGLGFETVWIPKFKELSKNTEFVNTTIGIERIENHDHHHHGSEGTCDHGDSDPHLWVSPLRAKKMAENTYEALLKANIMDKDTLNLNYQTLSSQFNKLDSLFRDASEKAENKTIVIYHPALAYIAMDYGFKQLSIEKEGKEPTAFHIKTLIDEIKSSGIKYIFIQKQFDKKSAQLIAKESGAELIEIDPLAYDYFDESTRLAEKLKGL